MNLNAVTHRRDRFPTGVGVNDIAPLVGWCGRPSRIPPGACSSDSLLYQIITRWGNALRVSC